MNVSRLVVTGGAASGKSHAADWLGARGEGAFERFDADACVRELLRLERNRQAVVERFGSELLREDGLDRSALRRRIFDQAADRRWLENLLHPQVAQARNELVARLESSDDGKICWIIAEIPLWFEAQVDWPVDRVLCIGCDRAIQLERLTQTRGLSLGQAEAVLASQWNSPRKAKAADLVCWNDGSLARFERQLQHVLSILLA